MVRPHLIAVWLLPLAMALLLGGCATWPATPPLSRAGATGYRFTDVAPAGQADDLLVYLAFSGGGLRAAALAYGALEELRRTEVPVHGVTRRLLDEVDVISAVSGGTLPGTYFALRGERTFTEFEPRVLSRDLELALAARILRPDSWFRLPSATFGKSDLFAELYDQEVFDGATYADLQRAGGPFVVVQATDVTTGAHFPFTQDQFDLICADLSKVTLGRAVATSTALPPLLTPITLENRAGRCGFTEPAWMAAADAAAARSETPGRAELRARARRAAADAIARPYLHLFDGGLAENLGLNSLLSGLDGLALTPDAPELARLRRARKVVVIVVNALRVPEVYWDRSPAPPGTSALQDQMWSIPVDRITLDAIEKTREQLERWRAAGPGSGPERRETYLAQVTFDDLPDPAERDRFRRIETNLALPKAQVDQLREVAGRLLRAAPGYQRLLEDLRAGR
jgi:NTE family protein